MNAKNTAMSIITVLAHAVGIAVTFTPPAMAQSKLPILFAQHVGVEVFRYDGCPEGMLGAFIPEEKVLVICDAAFVNEQVLTETVYHEAFHVLQWAANDNLNKFASEYCTPMSHESNDGYAAETNYTQDQRKEYEWAARICEDDYELMDNVFYNIITEQ